MSDQVRQMKDGTVTERIEAHVSSDVKTRIMQEAQKAETSMGAYVATRLELADKLDEVRALVATQAEDEGLWFTAETCPEGYLQQELRKLHRAVED